MNQQRLFHISSSHKSADILKFYLRLFSLFSTLQTFLISYFANSLKTCSMSKKKRKNLSAQFVVLTMLGGSVLLYLTLGTFISQKNQSSFLTSILSTNVANEKSKCLKGINIFKNVFCSDHIGTLSYQWFH